MAKQIVPAYYAFNKGIIGKLGLARADLKRTGLGAETQTNWMPRVLGSMMLRPGLEFIGFPRDLAGKMFPFIYSATDTGILEFTDSEFRAWHAEDNDVAHVQVKNVSTTITNGDFATDLSGWTDADETGAVSDWVTNGGTGCLRLTGTGYNAAKRHQLVSVSGSDDGEEHRLRIDISRAPVKIRVGSTLGGDEYITETDLGVGLHSLVVIPTADFYIQFLNPAIASGLVNSVAIESTASGTNMKIATPWTEALIPLMRIEQSADVVYVACAGVQQRKIERRANNSWSVVLYEPDDGPFLPPNTSNIILTPSAQTGNITLTASKPLFKSGHVGALYRIRSIGQSVFNLLAGDDQYTDPVRVVGVGADSRRLYWVITGTWSGTLTLQRSIGDTGSWSTVATKTANSTEDIDDDDLDNEIVYYRWGFRSGDYTSGLASVTLSNDGGGIEGVVRITSFSSSTSVSAVVIKRLGGLDGSTDWSEGTWSDYRGWPSSVALHEGRLWWAGKSRIIGSVSDAYASFDDTIEGDSGPIQRSIGRGPVDTINWLLPLDRMIAGATLAEWSVRSSSFDEILTPANFNLKPASTQGAAAVSPIQVDKLGFYVQRSGQSLNQIFLDGNGFDYTSDEASKLAPDLFSSGIVALAVQRRPDTRIHIVLGSGDVVILVFDKVEEVAGFILVRTLGTVEDVVILPGVGEDQVYYNTNRTDLVGAQRHLEKFAKESECIGGTLNKQADDFTVYEGAATTTIDVGTHLASVPCVVWADGKALGTINEADGTQQTYTPDASGILTLPAAYSNVVAGRPYQAKFKSTKLAYATGEAGTALNQPKRVSQIGIIGADMHYQGLRYGPAFDTLDNLPLMELGRETPADTVHGTYDEKPFEFPGEWDTDSRVCLEANAPRPVTLLSLVIAIDTNAKA